MSLKMYMSSGGKKLSPHLTIDAIKSYNRVYDATPMVVTFKVTNDGDSNLYDPIIYIYDSDTIFTTFTYDSPINISDSVNMSFTGPSDPGKYNFYPVIVATDENGDRYESEKSVYIPYFIIPPPDTPPDIPTPPTPPTTPATPS